MNFIIKILLIVLCATQVTFAASDRYLVEDNLTKLGQTTLDAMFGKDNFIVRVQVRMSESKYSVKYTQESTPKKSNKKKNQEEVYILPGVPALKNIAPGSLNQLPYDSVTTMVEPKIERILVTVLADKNYPRSQARKAELALTEVLSLKSGRDKVNVMFKPFYEDPNKDTQQITLIPGEENLVTVQNGFYLLLSLLLIIMIIIYIIYQNKLLKKQPEGQDSGGPSINVNPNLELPEGMGGGSGDKMDINMNADIKTYFDFVTKNNINDFVFLIKSQTLKPEYIAYIVSFLAPNLSAKILKELDKKTQAEITLLLADQKLGPKGILDKLETKLKADVECFVGGQDKVGSISNALTSTQRKEIVNTAKKLNPTNYKKIRPYMVLFDDIKLLDDSELQIVLSDLNLEQLATALVDAEQDIFAPIMDNLTKGAKDMVQQYLELKSNSTNLAQKEKAQDDILKIVKKLDSQGKINLLEKLKNV